MAAKEDTEKAEKPLSYVAQREAELKAELATISWWNTLAKMWEDLALCAEYKRRADLNMAKYNAIRADYVKRGRKPGYSPKTAKAA